MAIGDWNADEAIRTFEGRSYKRTAHYVAELSNPADPSGGFKWVRTTNNCIYIGPAPADPPEPPDTPEAPTSGYLNGEFPEPEYSTLGSWWAGAYYQWACYNIRNNANSVPYVQCVLA